MKDNLLRSVLPKIEVVDNSDPRSGKSPLFCNVSEWKKTSTFKKRKFDETYYITKQFYYNCKKAVSLIECNKHLYVANNILVAPKPNFVIELTTMNVCTENLRIKCKFPKKFWNRKFSKNPITLLEQVENQKAFREGVLFIIRSIILITYYDCDHNWSQYVINIFYHYYHYYYFYHY